MLFVSLLIVGLACLLLRIRFSKSSTTWLVASEPVLAACTKVVGVDLAVSLSISNVGPQSFLYDVTWIECRARADLRPLTLRRVLPIASHRSLLLEPGKTTNLVIEMSNDGMPIDWGLFSCQIEWIESESWLYGLGKQVDRPMYWLANLFGSTWEPPWRRKRFAGGDVFVSNIGVADYFTRVYGFTRAQWLERQRVERLAEELARQAAAHADIAVRRSIRSGASTTEDELSENAKRAFEKFCRTDTTRE
jgi:hypothetical protein